MCMPSEFLKLNLMLTMDVTTQLANKNLHQKVPFQNADHRSQFFHCHHLVFQAFKNHILFSMFGACPQGPNSWLYNCAFFSLFPVCKVTFLSIRLSTGILCQANLHFQPFQVLSHYCFPHLCIK